MTMATEEENVELGHHQGLHGYGFGLAYGTDLECTKTTLGKEIKKLQFHGEILKDAILEKEYQKLQRLTESTIPSKLDLIENIIEKVQELMIDSDNSIQEVKDWNSETRESFKSTLEVFENGKYILQQYRDEKARSTKAKLQEEEKELKEAEIRERKMFEEQIAKEKFAAERALWMEQRKVMLETKERELEMERMARGATANLPNLNISPFKGTPKDWIRFNNQFVAQIDSQPVSKTIKLGYLLQCVKGECHDLIGNIPNNDEGYDRALKILKEEYGQERLVLASHTREIINLPYLKGSRYLPIKEFYETLRTNYEALRAMRGHERVEGLVLSTLEKLPGIKPDLTRNDEKWEMWTFDELLTELRIWLKRNYVDHSMGSLVNEKVPDHIKYRSKSFLTSAKRGPRCFYCPDKHWPDKCDRVTDPKERKEFLKKRGLCYKCGQNHLVKDCSRRGCFICKGNHHSSLHVEKEEKESEHDALNCGYTPSGECALPLIPLEIKGETIWGFLDTCSTRNYISRQAVEQCSLKPVRWETVSLRTVEGQGKTSKRPVYSIGTYDLRGHKFEFEVIGLDQSSFSEIERESSKNLREKYNHLRGLYIPESKDGKYMVHILFGDPTFIEMRTGECRKGKAGQPIADETIFGWTVHGDKSESDHSYFTQTTNDDYEKLYTLDVLGVEDRKEFDQEEVRKDFLENVIQLKDGRYQVKIPWIDERIPRNTNEVQSKLRLYNLFRRMKDETRKDYDAIIKEQLELGIIEEAPVEPTGKRVYYMPHKPVIRESVASTKIRMVFDASCKPTVTDYSINECMNPGPPTQPLLWDILIRSRIAPVCIVGDVTKAFLQIELHEEDRGAFRFIYKLTDEPEKKFRFKRLPFGGESSPFVLGGVLQHHLEKTEGDEKVK